MNKKANMFKNLLVVFSIFTLIWVGWMSFYASTISDYDDILNITEDASTKELNLKINETFDKITKESTILVDTTGNTTGTSSTGLDDMIIGGFRNIYSFVGTFAPMMVEVLNSTAHALKIEPFWVTAAIGIISILFFLALIGILRGVFNW